MCVLLTAACTLSAVVLAVIQGHDSPQKALLAKQGVAVFTTGLLVLTTGYFIATKLRSQHNHHWYNQCDFNCVLLCTAAR
jgi:hypothetical protein